MFENPVVEEIDSLVRQFISESSLDKAMELLFKCSEMKDLADRLYPINHNLLQAYVRDGGGVATELFKKREKLMREFYIGEIQPHFKPYLTRRE